MSVLKSLFGKNNNASEKASHINWVPLTDIAQLKEIELQSNDEPVAIFKHSTRCGISTTVIRKFEKKFDKELENFKVYYLDLLNYRDISNEISSVYQIRHESPQLIVLKGGKPVANASHGDIIGVDLKTF